MQTYQQIIVFFKSNIEIGFEFWKEVNIIRKNLEQEKISDLGLHCRSLLITIRQIEDVNLIERGFLKEMEEIVLFLTKVIGRLEHRVNWD